MSSLVGKEILIIDDVEDMRTLVRRILEADGATVIDAATVDQALELARKKAPHLILVDLRIPEKNGFDLLELRKIDPLLQGIPSIVLSGEINESEIKRAIDLGADAYILKPFRTVFLLQKIRKSLRLSNLKSKVLTPKEFIKVHLSFPGEIMKVSEIGCQIETPIKISSDERLQIKSDALDNLGIENVLMTTFSPASASAQPGRYSSEVNFLGVDHNLAKQIRYKLGTLR